MKKKKFMALNAKKASRKEKRKADRQLKKAKKNEHYFKIRNKLAPVHPSKIPAEEKGLHLNSRAAQVAEAVEDNSGSEQIPVKASKVEKTLVEKIKEATAKSQKIAEKKLLAEKRSRKLQLKEANKLEEKQIKHLAMLMKMNKRKKDKTNLAKMPKVFTDDGLDYLLDVTDPDKLKSLKMEDPTFGDDDDDFERDICLVKGIDQPPNENDGIDPDEDGESDSNTNDAVDDEDSDSDDMNEEEELVEPDALEDEVADELNDDDADSSGDSDEEECEDSHVASSCELGESRINEGAARVKRESSELDEEAATESIADNTTQTKSKKIKKSLTSPKDGTWEDIYGRLRSKDGAIIKQTGAGDPAGPACDPAAGRYVPPALRAQQLPLSGDKRLQLAQLRRRLQGQLNRLSARSARGVLVLVEDLYATHARHDTSQTLTQLVHEACVSAAAVRAERLVMEHVLLIAALHANVGTEVGAHFLLQTTQRFHKLLTSEPVNEESKELDNLIVMLCHLYLFRVTDSRVVYDILALLVERFSSKDVELILLVLRSVGFVMRKDDPKALKELIVRLQTRAAAAAGAAADGSRVRFMLDIVMALRNNNMKKIPQYDPGLSEELRKLLKTLVNPSQTLTELTICLDDLLKAEERGKWWVVGSAWSGALKERDQLPATAAAAAGDRLQPAAGAEQLPRFSAELLELARQQRMNTELRRAVFCVLMTAEDYMDGFERLMRLGVRGPHQEQELVTVVVGCSMRERAYNAYYSHLLERLCAADRKYQMRVKVAFWDQLKNLGGLGARPAGNLARTLAHLIDSGTLTIAVLKVVEFSEMSRPMVRFLRQLLLSLLLTAEDGVARVFSRASGDHLRHLRSSLTLFLHHFVLRNKTKLADASAHALEERVRAAIDTLKAGDGRLKL